VLILSREKARRVVKCGLHADLPDIKGFATDTIFRMTNHGKGTLIKPREHGVVWL
jgi:hypothetical protein